MGARTSVAIRAAIATPTAWIVLVAGLGFTAPAVVALRVLGEIDDLTRPGRLVRSAERAAGLTPRKVGDYLPSLWRAVASGAAILGAAAFVIRTWNDAFGTPLLVPTVFALGGLVFLWLYEVWVHQLVTGPIVDGDRRDLRGTVRRIFGMEVLLILVCLVTAHALISLDPSAALRAAISLAASVVAIAGCALALASGLMGRRYETAR